MCITGNDIGIVKDIIMSIAASLTAWVAYSGLNKWKKELKGKIDFDTAHALIKAAYKLRNELKYARAPFIPAQEFPNNYNPIKADSDKKADALAYIYSNRMKRVIEATEELEVRALEAEALWGNQIKELTMELKSCSIHLNISFEEDIRNEYSGYKHFQADDVFRKEIKQDIWVSSKEDDPLSIRIHNAIKNIENEIRPYLDKK